MSGGHVVSQGKFVGDIPAIDGLEDGVVDNLGAVTVNVVPAVLPHDNKVGMGVWLYGGKGFGELRQGDVRGDYAQQLVLFVVKRAAVGGNHMVRGKRAVFVIHKRFHPNGFAGNGRFSVPVILEVLVLVLDGGDECIFFADRIGGEITLEFRKQVWSGRYGAAGDQCIFLDHSPGVGQQGVRAEILFYQPGACVGGRFYRLKVALCPRDNRAQGLRGIIYGNRVEMTP